MSSNAATIATKSTTTDNNNKNDDSGGTGTNHIWEDAVAAGTGQANWENAVQEDEDGNIITTQQTSEVELIRKRRKRLERNDYTHQRKRVIRDMIRYMYIVLDVSRWMREKDTSGIFTGVDTGGGPNKTRLDYVITILNEFIYEFFDQNPLSHLGIILVRNGESEILTNLSSSSKTHRIAIQSISKLVASDKKGNGGDFSLQNGLELAGRSLGHQPKHGSREIVVLCSALSTCDPGNILVETLPNLIKSNIRVSTLALVAEMYICRKIATDTNGIIGVCLDRTSIRDWLITGQCVPPPHHSNNSNNTGSHHATCDMVQIGFPTRIKTDVPTLTHISRETKIFVTKDIYDCPQCQSKSIELPTDCVVCGLQLVLAPHLARSFHHLFPVSRFIDINNTNNKDNTNNNNPNDDNKDSSRHHCFACYKFIGQKENGNNSNKGEKNKKKLMDKSSKNNTAINQVEEENGSSSILRFQCPDCLNVFCSDCDAYLHETLHNCPGCLSSSSSSK